MKLAELRDFCLEQQRIIGSEDAHVMLILPYTGRWGERRRLCGRSGPLGRVVGAIGKGVMVDFKANEILDFLGKHKGAIAALATEEASSAT